MRQSMGINTDERRAKKIAKQTFECVADDQFEEKWEKFKNEKTRFGKPEEIAKEFENRWDTL